MRILIIAACLSLASIALASLPKNRCADFDQVALQLALVSNHTSSPYNLEKIQEILGVENSKTTSSTSSYSWVNKELALIINVSGDNITNTVLSGNIDNSTISKKMAKIHNDLKSATSIWSIQTVRTQLGQEVYRKSSILNSYSWQCNNSSIIATINENNDIISAIIDYKGSPNSINSRVIPGHPEWDEIKPASLSESHYIWQRTFTH